MFEATTAASAREIPALALRALTCAGGAAVLLVVAAAGGAEAQSLNANSSQFNSGYNAAGSLNGPINIATRDGNNNSVYVNGIMQTPAGSIFSNATGVSQSSTSGGVGSSGMATAIGNSLNVVVEGSWNRVTVDSTQVNNGNISATTSLNGQIKLEGP
jgi:holdfast attachment protein HfaA